MMSNFRKNNLPLKKLPFFGKIWFFFVCDYNSAEKLSKYTTYAHVSFHFLWNSKALAFGIFCSYLVPLDIEIRAGSSHWRGAQQPMVEVHHYGRDRNLDFGIKMLLYFTKEVPGDWLLPSSTPIKALRQLWETDSEIWPCIFLLWLWQWTIREVLGKGHSMSRP